MKTRVLWLGVLGTVWCLGLPLPTMADEMDVGYLAPIYGVLKQYLTNLADLTTILQTEQNVEASVKTVQADLTGNFGYGNWLNSEADLAKRQWSNDTWSDVMQMVNNDKTGAFTQAQQQYSQLYPIANANQIGTTEKNGGLTRAFYQQDSAISRAALAASSTSYNQINEHIQSVHDILKKLEEQPSAKAAQDLTARLTAEISFIQLESLKQQNFQTQLAATQSQAQVNGLSDEAQFLQWKP